MVRTALSSDRTVSGLELWSRMARFVEGFNQRPTDQAAASAESCELSNRRGVSGNQLILDSVDNLHIRRAEADHNDLLGYSIRWLLRLADSQPAWN